MAPEMLPNSMEYVATVSGTSEAVTRCIYCMCCVMLEVRIKMLLHLNQSIFAASLARVAHRLKRSYCNKSYVCVNCGGSIKKTDCKTTRDTSASHAL
jgi:hypothetical protein